MAGIVRPALLVGVSVAALWVGATLFVTNAARVARRLGVPELVVGLTVVGFGTSAPELVTSVDAALVGAADVAVGNVVGSNLFNLGVVLGGLALFGSVAASRSLARRDAPAMLGATLLLPLLLSDLRLGRSEGLALLGLLAVYLGVLIRQARDEAAVTNTSDDATAGPRAVLVAIAGLGLVVAGADLLVRSAIDLARLAGLSEWVIGETVVAVATSTPEVAASLVAVRQGMRELAAGNVVGSNVFNVLGILGVTAVVRPLSVTPTAVPTVLWLVGLTALVVVLLTTRRRLSRLEGAVAVAVNLVRWGLDVLG
ncbi:calcium/sodium antiporter [Halorarius litoreus]|uniref:calcium/sodium antiporter n=1 Tax=Halorarius litoreus TaxID=2962676 RepID=UPI0020CFB84B|nr:calcium/sodium antiporter [Halorarius litoreus]